MQVIEGLSQRVNVELKGDPITHPNTRKDETGVEEAGPGQAGMEEATASRAERVDAGRRRGSARNHNQPPQGKPRRPKGPKRYSEQDTQAPTTPRPTLKLEAQGPRRATLEPSA